MAYMKELLIDAQIAQEQSGNDSAFRLGMIYAQRLVNTYAGNGATMLDEDGFMVYNRIWQGIYDTVKALQDDALGIEPRS